MRHGVPLSLERSSTSPYTPCIGVVTLAFKIKVKIEVDFFHWLPLREFLSAITRKLHRKSEEATRQQGGLFFRENSSNGGKAIRTFWRNTKFGKIPCQGQNFPLVSGWSGDSYRGY